MPKCFSAWNAVLNKSVTMHFRHEKTWNTMERDWMKILIFYSLIMSFSCATCMSTLGFCIIFVLFSGSLPSTSFALKLTSQYYFVLQSLHKALPSTTLYYKACTKHFPALLCTTKLAQSHFPVLLCTTKLAQTTSQHYFVLQSLHKFPSTTLYFKVCTKSLPSTILYYKACTKHFPVLLCTTKFAQSYFPALLCTTKLAQS